MRVHFPGDPLPQEMTYGVFLLSAAPQEQTGTALPWHTEALRILAELAFAGDVHVPEPRADQWVSDADQISWRESALNRSDRILMWLPEDCPHFSSLTNDSWGYWRSRDPARFTLGTSATGREADQLRNVARALDTSVFLTLEESCRAIVAERGALRRGGECQVPLHIWQTQSFQAWYTAQTNAGNLLHGASVEWVFRIRPGIVFYWALRIDMEVRAEGRRKSNEVILGRPDIAAVVLYRLGQDLLDTDVVLVREFRSASRTPDGCIWELPSGSTLTESVPTEITAVQEIKEELGLTIDPRQLRRHATRQLVGTLSVHQAQVFSLELTAAQLAGLQEQERTNATHGDRQLSEITSIRVRKVRDILVEPYADWSTLGILFAVLQEQTP